MDKSENPQVQASQAPGELSPSPAAYPGMLWKLTKNMQLRPRRSRSFLTWTPLVAPLISQRDLRHLQYALPSTRPFRQRLLSASSTWYRVMSLDRRTRLYATCGPTNLRRHLRIEPCHIPGGRRIRTCWGRAGCSCGNLMPCHLQREIDPRHQEPV